MDFSKELNKDKKLNEEENIIQRIEGQINEINSYIRKKYELENKINEQKIIFDKMDETKEKKFINDELKNNLRKRMNQLDIEINKFMIAFKNLENEKQREESSKREFDLDLSAPQKEIKNSLKKIDEIEDKKRDKLKRISNKLKKKLTKKNIEKIKTNVSVIIKREKLEASKYINKFKKKKENYINNLKEKNSNNKKSKELNNKNDENIKLLNDEIEQLKNKLQILENENNELRNKNMALSKVTKEKLDIKNEIQNFRNTLSDLQTNSDINILKLKLEEILNNQRKESNSQKQNDSDISGSNSIISQKVNSQIIFIEEQEQ